MTSTIDLRNILIRYSKRMFLKGYGDAEARRWANFKSLTPRVSHSLPSAGSGERPPINSQRQSFQTAGWQWMPKDRPKDRAWLMTFRTTR